MFVKDPFETKNALLARVHISQSI